MSYKIYAVTYPDNRVYQFISSEEIDPPFKENCFKIGESEDENAHKNYQVVDVYGIYNYEIVNGILCERDKSNEMTIIENQMLNAQYIPSKQKSFDFAFQKILGSTELEDSEKISVSAFYPNWVLGKYEVGDVRNYAGQTWECWTAHDNAIYPDINPDNPQTWANFWRPLHGTSKETARPFVKPQYGTTDMYHAGEYMVWTDGNTYRCKENTAYNPEEYAQAWELYSE